MSSSGVSDAGGHQGVERHRRIGRRVGAAREQREVLGQRTGGEGRRGPGAGPVEDVAPAVDEPAESAAADHVEHRVSREPERLAPRERPAQRRQRVAEHPVGDQLERGRLGRTRRGRAVSPSDRSTASTSAVGLPPARIVSRPAATAGVEPMTGACRYAAPVAATRWARSAASSGSDGGGVHDGRGLGRQRGRIGASTSRQAWASYRQSSTTSAPSTASTGAPPPLRVQVRTSWSAESRAAMAEPMRPRPRTVTEVMSPACGWNRHATSASHACQQQRSVMMATWP